MTPRDRRMTKRMFVLIMRGIFVLLAREDLPTVKEALTQNYYDLEVDLLEWSDQS